MRTPCRGRSPLGSPMWVEMEQLFFRQPAFLGACVLPTPKWAHSCWSQPRLPACDCKVLFWKGKCAWIRLSSLNFSRDGILLCLYHNVGEQKYKEQSTLTARCRKDMIWVPVCEQTPWHGHHVRWGCPSSQPPSLGTRKPSWNANCWIYINLYKLCKSAVAHRCGLGGSRAVLTTSCWADTGFIHYNKWFCCRVFGKQLLLVLGCRCPGLQTTAPGCSPCSLVMSSLFLRWHEERSWTQGICFQKESSSGFSVKRLKTLTRDNYKRKMNLFLDQKLLCKRVCKLWRAS